MATEARARQWTRRLRRFIYLGTLVGVVFLFVSYDVVRIPDDYPHLLPQQMGPGTRVVLTECDEDTKLGLDSVVVYEPVGFPGKRCWGVIAGVPGEMISVMLEDGGVARVKLGDRTEVLLAPDDWKLSSGVIPAGQFVVLTGDRHLRVPCAFPDSRRLGPIARERIAAKVVVQLSFF